MYEVNYMVFDIDYIGLFGTRIAALREQKGGSAREMSLALGQSESYINKIENKRTFPSMSGFIYICEYLEVTPAEFFDFSIKSPAQLTEFTSAASALSPEQTEHVLQIIKDITKKQ